MPLGWQIESTHALDRRSVAHNIDAVDEDGWRGIIAILLFNLPIEAEAPEARCEESSCSFRVRTSCEVEKLDRRLGAHDASLYVRTRVGENETVAVRHAHLREGGSIEYVILAHDIVEVENVRGHRVNLVGGERPRRVVRHRAVNVVPNGRRIRPVASDRENRLLASEGPESARELGIVFVWRFAASTVAWRAPRRIEGRASQRCAASFGQSRARRRDRNIEGPDLRWRRKATNGRGDAVGLSGRDRATDQRERGEQSYSPTHAPSPFRRRERAMS